MDTGTLIERTLVGAACCVVGFVLGIGVASTQAENRATDLKTMTCKWVDARFDPSLGEYGSCVSKNIIVHRFGL
jgi:hypothetical protein